MTDDKVLDDQRTRKVIGAAFRVFNVLGFGFAESVYERALSHELTKAGVTHSCEVPLQVWYDGRLVGDFFADLLVEQVLVVELKSVRRLLPAHEVQLVNYLSASGNELGLLINFSPEGVEVRRKYRSYVSQQSGLGRSAPCDPQLRRRT